MLWRGANAHLGVWTATVSLIHLPIGVSFYTFMGISCLVDAYRDASETEPALRLSVVTAQT